MCYHARKLTPDSVQVNRTALRAGIFPAQKKSIGDPANWLKCRGIEP